MVSTHHAVLGKKDWKRASRPLKDSIPYFSLGLNVVLILSILYLLVFIVTTNSQPTSTEGNQMVWHGGHPADIHPGSCWCDAQDKYCMCTPNIAVDVVIVSGHDNKYLWLVRRRDTNQLATMGGFVEIDESVEHAVRRECKEEMGVDFKEPPKLFGVYSDPRRDNRRRTVSVVYVVFLDQDTQPHAGDDAKEVKKISIDDIEKYEYFADHRTILLDYRRALRGEEPAQSTEGDFAPDIRRSICDDIINAVDDDK